MWCNNRPLHLLHHPNNDYFGIMQKNSVEKCIGKEKKKEGEFLICITRVVSTD